MTRWARLACLWLLLVSVAAPVSATGPAARADARVDIRVDGPAPVADNVAQQLATRQPSLVVQRDAAAARLVVAVGAQAFRAAVAAQGAEANAAPVVGIALTRHAWRQAPRGKHTALFWDPSPAKQLQLARALLPGARRAGVLLGDADDTLVASLRAEAARQRLELVVATVPAGDNLPRALGRVLADSDFLLGIDDPAVFSPAVAKSLLLTSYRHGKPVIGPTAAWVDAGAVASLSATLDDHLEALVAWLPQLLAGELPQATHLSRYRVATNPSVARSLQLSLPPPPALDALVREEETRP